MKRFSMILVACAVLFLGLMPLQASASSGGPSFYVGSNIAAGRGGTVTVPITVSNNPGFAAVGLIMTYDTNVLQIVSVTDPVAAMPLNSQFALTTSPGTQWISLVNTGLSDWYGNGTVANVTFNVRNDAPIGNSSIGLSFTGTPDGTPSNSNGDLLWGSGVSGGSVSVSTTAPINTGPSFNVGANISAERGSTVTVPISVSNNPGFMSAGLVLTYDSSALSLTGVTAPIAAMPLSSQFALTTSPGSQTIRFLNSNYSNWSGNGTVANVTFTVRSNAPLGTSFIGIALASSPDGTPRNSSDEYFRQTVLNSGSVNISDPYYYTTYPPTTTYPPPDPNIPLIDGNNEPSGGLDIDFIGTTPSPGPEETDSGSDASPGVRPPTTSPGTSFGPVPQTGVPDILALSAALAASGLASSVFWLRSGIRFGKRLGRHKRSGK